MGSLDFGKWAYCYKFHTAQKLKLQLNNLLTKPTKTYFWLQKTADGQLMVNSLRKQIKPQLRGIYFAVVPKVGFAQDALG